MANKICRHGEQTKLSGGGIYFLCRFNWQEKGEEWRTNSPCRYVRWCKEDKRYYASVDKGGNTCLHFELLRPIDFTEAPVEIPEVQDEEGLELLYDDNSMLNDLEIIFEEYNIDQE